MAVLLETSLGDLAIDLYVKEAPKECLNFLKLCKMKYYNFSLVDRVQKNFVLETGKPLFEEGGPQSIWGYIEGPGSKFFLRNVKNRLKHKKFGTVSMINDGNGLHASQFLITLTDNCDSLDGKHSVFGEVAEESYEVLRKINDVFCDDNGVPYQDIRAAGGLCGVCSMFAHVAKTGRIRDDEDVNADGGLTEAQMAEMVLQRQTRTNLQILEMVGDIPDMDVKPPDNVLFICKLNPVTTDEDLRLIFSRFGKILSCEVIRDRRSNDSLQYAFVEFERPEDCEEAFFKMDNVLIDDRRIHVDFSQSVSKMNYQMPTRGFIKSQPHLALKSTAHPSADKYAMVFDDGATGHGAGHRHRSRSPARHQERDHRDRDRDHDRGKDHGKERGREREHDRGRDRDRERDWDRGKDHHSHSHRDRDRDDRDRRHDSSRRH